MPGTTGQSAVTSEFARSGPCQRYRTKKHRSSNLSGVKIRIEQNWTVGFLKNAFTPKILNEMGWLAASPPGFRQALFDGASLQRIAAGAYLYHIDDDANGLWGLESGSVAVEYAHPSGLLKPACVLHRGHWGGEGPILDGRKRSVGIRALQDCMFCRVPLGHVRRLLATNPQYWREIGRLALEHYDLTAGIAADGMIPDSRRRLVAVLMRLAGLRDPYPLETGEIHLSKSEIASIVNLSRSSLTPLLIDLQAKGVIELGYRRIRVQVPARLLSNSLTSDDSP